MLLRLEIHRYQRSHILKNCRDSLVEHSNECTRYFNDQRGAKDVLNPFAFCVVCMHHLHPAGTAFSSHQSRQVHPRTSGVSMLQHPLFTIDREIVALDGWDQFVTNACEMHVARPIGSIHAVSVETACRRSGSCSRSRAVYNIQRCPKCVAGLTEASWT